MQIEMEAVAILQYATRIQFEFGWKVWRAWSPQASRCTEMELASVHLMQYTTIQLYKYTNTQIHKYTNIQIHKCTNIWIYKYKNTKYNRASWCTILRDEIGKYASHARPRQQPQLEEMPPRPPGLAQWPVQETPLWVMFCHFCCIAMINLVSW